ncbi:hypothetical protein TVAG_021670 [Trichomonas vaginalis G3]|uniref:Uncharacterized protein n=1 Tax=Trichomonas vaginalis (strain ATCC PRA-98 / G3) TaxID=412133 RepID=A2DHE7_TRIV3|nr:protein ubiquitination [Trichomonas vaginalis G3]EAY20220.1 hypothetical protein TVAG_021670 [Trichomonas vaginalis G3]KAI5507715.1 protein ubiquitination [Trichomonas vaginalis G3]|eukprot:XP_001581206.1 hypothetical protein [Trichomonas vaginalis G3]
MRFGWRFSALHIAVKYDSVESAEVLLWHGVEVNAKDINRIPPLHLAKSSKMVKLLRSYGVNVNAKDKYGRNALHFAVYNCVAQEIAEILISSGINVNSKTKEGKTPLHYAVVRHPDISRLLISLGADVNAKDRHGLTPLQDAIKNNKIAVAQLLASYPMEQVGCISACSIN